MEKILNYQEIITNLLAEYAQDWNSPQLEIQLIKDTQNHHYQLVLLGWAGDKYVHSTPIHLDIRDGKVWLQQNLTEEFIAEELVKRGIPKSDIVLGLQPPVYRKYTDFAVA